MRTIMLSLVAVFAVTLSAQDTKADQIRKTFAKFQDSVTTLSWTNTTSARGQDMERERSTTAVLLPGGLGMVTASATKSQAGGLASMFGGGTSKDSGWKLNIGEGLDCVSIHEDSDQNLQFFAAPVDLAGVAFPEKADVPALAEEVLIVSVHGKSLKHAKFFRLARINSVIEDGQVYGLDGSVGDCLGGLVVTLDGKVLGIVGQVKNESASGGGGIGRMLGGLDDPASAMGNRVLLTPAVFASAIKAAKMAAEGIEPAPAETPTAPASGETTFKGLVASAVKRTARKDTFVLVNVLEDQTAPNEGDTMSILDKKGTVIGTFEVARRYKDAEGRVEQVGGAVKGTKADIVKGLSAVTFAKVSASEGLKLEAVSGDKVAETYGATAGLKVIEAPAEGGTAAKSGLKKGDLIVKFGDTRVTAETTTEAFAAWLKDAKAGTITVARIGSTDLTDLTIK
ncbi:PDZ domain-containing protein [Planctomycetota bacterium]|nr:PDZ domain-containing protein [Planctomycetota bacterium]